MRGRIEIAVAGAGPAGLASALYLHRLGHRVTIFERYDAPRPIGSGLLLQPTGQAVLQDLGLLADVRALGRRIDRLDGRDARTGRRVLDVRYDALPGGRHAIGVHRAALFSVLHDAVVAAGIPVETGRTLAGLHQLAGGRVGLAFAAGRQAGPFDLVVDATGAGTPLRAAARHRGTPRPMRYGAVWATVPWTAGFDEAALMQRYRRASVMIGVLPIGRQRPGGEELAAFFWSLPVEAHVGLLAAGFAAWRAEVTALWPETAPLLEAIGGFEALTLARYVHATMPVPAGDAIAFVGDSAHSTSPQLGQGANMALLDAKALAVALEAAPDVATALSRYAALRRRHVRLYQAMSLLLTPLYQSDSRMLPIVRDLLVAHAGRVPPVPRLLAAMVSGQLFIDAVAGLGLEPARE